MNIDQAFKILDLPKSASDDEIRAKYKSLAKQFHPDINKNEPEKFKEINQANDLIKDFKANPNKYANNSFGKTSAPGYGSININDIFNGFQSHFQQSGAHRTPTHINLSVSISFKQSVIGCDKDILYTRNIKCVECNGDGVKYKGNGCDTCDGFGKVVSQKGNMQFVRSCNKCQARNITEENCLCNGKGTTPQDVQETVSIPAGRHSGDVLQMRGKGNFVDSNMFGEHHTDVLISISVEKDDELELIEQDVVSKVNVSLLEAFTGCEKLIKTIDGNKTITIEKMSHNKDEVSLPKLGVINTNGKHRAIINIKYPSDEITEMLVELMKEQNVDRTKLHE